MTETATLDEAGSPRDLLGEINFRLTEIAKVLQREHDWLKPQVDYSREIDDADIAYSLKIGHIDEDHAKEKRAEDNLILRRDQVDKHLENIRLAAGHLDDIASTMKAFSIDDGGAA